MTLNLVLTACAHAHVALGATLHAALGAVGVCC